MSLFPNEPATVKVAAPGLQRVSAWRRSLGRSLRRARGQVPPHTLYLQAQGVRAWTAVDARTTGVVATAAFENFDAWCRVNPNTDTRVFVSGHLLHSLIVDPVLGLRDAAAVRSYARQQFVHYHGNHARLWPLAVWSSARCSGACAAHSVDVDALRATAATHDVHLHSIAPVWSAGLASLTRQVPSLADPGPSALALVEGSLVTWMMADAGTITSMQQRYLDAPRRALLTELLDRLVAETGPFAQPAVIVGWGLEDGPVATALRANGTTALDDRDTDRDVDRDAAARWLLDAMADRA